MELEKSRLHGILGVFAAAKHADANTQQRPFEASIHTFKCAQIARLTAVDDPGFIFKFVSQWLFSPFEDAKESNTWSAVQVAGSFLGSDFDELDRHLRQKV